MPKSVALFNNQIFTKVKSIEFGQTDIIGKTNFAYSAVCIDTGLLITYIKDLAPCSRNTLS